MTLFVATLLAGVIILSLGIAVVWSSKAVRAVAASFPRSEWAAAIVFSIAVIWFLLRVSALKEADLVFFQNPLPVMVGFGLLAALAYIYLREFLAVRGLCIVTLLGAERFLGAAYGQYAYPQRLLMVTSVYIAISISIYLAVSPYRFRDFFDWLFRKTVRAQLLGVVLLLYGAATTAAAYTYQ